MNLAYLFENKVFLLAKSWVRLVFRNLLHYIYELLHMQLKH